MYRKPSITSRLPLQGQCVFVHGSMSAAGTWVHGGKPPSVLGGDETVPHRVSQILKAA